MINIGTIAIIQFYFHVPLLLEISNFAPFNPTYCTDKHNIGLKFLSWPPVGGWVVGDFGSEMKGAQAQQQQGDTAGLKHIFALTIS